MQLKHIAVQLSDIVMGMDFNPGTVMIDAIHIVDKSKTVERLELPCMSDIDWRSLHGLLIEELADTIDDLHLSLKHTHDSLLSEPNYLADIQDFIVFCFNIKIEDSDSLWMLFPGLSSFFKTLFDAIDASDYKDPKSFPRLLNLDEKGVVMPEQHLAFYRQFLAIYSERSEPVFSEVMEATVQRYFEATDIASNFLVQHALEYAQSKPDGSLKMSFFLENIDSIYKTCTRAPFSLNPETLFEDAVSRNYFIENDLDVKATFVSIVQMFNEMWVDDYEPSSVTVNDEVSQANILECLRNAVSSSPRPIPAFMANLFNAQGDFMFVHEADADTQVAEVYAEVSADVLKEKLDAGRVLVLDDKKILAVRLIPQDIYGASTRRLRENKDDEALELLSGYCAVKNWLTPVEVTANYSESLQTLMTGARKTPIIKALELILTVAMNPDADASKRLILEHALSRREAISKRHRQTSAEDFPDLKENLGLLCELLNELCARVKSGTITTDHVEWTGKSSSKEYFVQRYLNRLVTSFQKGKSITDYFSAQTDSGEILSVLPEATHKDLAQKKAYSVLFDLLKIAVLNHEADDGAAAAVITQITANLAEVLPFLHQDARTLLIVGLNRFEAGGIRTLLRGLEVKLSSMDDGPEKEAVKTLFWTLIRLANKEIVYLDGEQLVGKYGVIKDNTGEGDCFYLALSDAARIAVKNGGRAQWKFSDDATCDVQNGRHKVSAVMAIKLSTLCMHNAAGDFSGKTLLDDAGSSTHDFRLILQLCTSFKRFTEEMVRKYSNVSNVVAAATPYLESVRDFERFERPVLTQKLEALFERLFSADVRIFYNESNLYRNDSREYRFNDGAIRELLPSYHPDCPLHNAVKDKLNEQLLNIHAMFPRLSDLTGTPDFQEMKTLHPAMALAEAFDSLSQLPVSSLLIHDSPLMSLCKGYAEDVLLTPTYFTALKGQILDSIFPEIEGVAYDLNKPAIVNSLVRFIYAQLEPVPEHLLELFTSIQFHLTQALTGGIRLFDPELRRTVLKQSVTATEFKLWFRQQTFVKWAESPEVSVVTALNKTVELSIQQPHGIVLGSIHETEFVRANLTKPNTLRVMQQGEHYVALAMLGEGVASTAMAVDELAQSVELSDGDEDESRQKVGRLLQYLQREGSEP